MTSPPLPRDLNARLIFRLCLALTSFVVGHAGLCSEAAEPIVYTLQFPAAQNHYIEVDARFPGSDTAATEIMMAVWTPGSYVVRDYARHVDSIVAVDAAGKELPLEKTRTNRWLIAGQAKQPFTVRYRLYCRELSVRTNWVGREYAMLNGAPTFITLADGQDRPHQVKLKLPDHWRQSITSLSRLDDGSPHHYQADNFDQLVDSPIVCGNPEVYRFRVGDREHLLVNEGEGDIWDGAQSAEHVGKLVREHQRMWGVVPYDSYIFFNMIVQTGGGLEHDNSTLMLTNRWYFRQRKDYLRWLGLVSHEFFHTWNVRRLRPVPLVTYDYESENYTRSLWIAEGITSYYDDLAIARSGLCTQKEYLGLLAKNIETLQANPGRRIQSLRDSSHDAWIKFYRPDENSNNSRVSYYTKGAVVAFLLDAKIRQSTDGKKSLDDVMRLLYKQFAGERGYTPAQFRALASRVAGVNLTDWFQATIDAPGDVDYDDALAWYGLQFKPETTDKPDGESADQDKADQDKANQDKANQDKADQDKKEDDDKSNQPQRDGDKPAPVWLGITTRTDGGRLVISRIQSESPAYRAGLNVDDELIAINGFRVPPDKWSDRLKQYQPGTTLQLLVARREALTTIAATLDKPPRKNWQLIPLAKPSHAQQRNLRQWLQPQ